jgi:polyhydroxyalkanoate synthesis regulator protein
MGLIRMYGNPMQDMVGEFLTRSFDTLMEQQNQYQEQMRKAMEASPLAAMQKLTAENLKSWQAMQDAFLNKMTGKNDKTE